MATVVDTQTCSSLEGPKQIEIKIFLNKWLLQTFVYLEIRLKCHGEAERGKASKASEKHHI